MANQKVIVPLLNKRSLPVPDTRNTGNIIGKVKKDFEFESVEQQTNAAGDWFKDRDGSWYWGGGLSGAVNFVPPPPVAAVPSLVQERFQFDPAKISWAHSALKIIDIWQDAKVAGKNARVAILDESFDATHIDLKPLLTQDFSAATDINNHGTEMAGIIGAKGNKVTGVAPECEMLFAKVNFDAADSIIKAIQWASNNNADVISLSFTCDFDDGIEAEFEKCFNKNIAILAAVGDSGASNIVIDNLYPASSPFAFAIGCFGKDFKRMRVSSLSNHLKLLAPSQSILTAIPVNNAQEIDGATSLATAFTSGIVALLLSATRNAGKNVSGKEIIEALCKNADKRNNGNDDHNVEYGFGLINPIQTYFKLK